MKDQLFLLRPGFTIEGRGPFYCNDSVSVEGLLGFFPVLRERLDVRYIEFPRPRLDVVTLLGVEHQSMPVLVLADVVVPFDPSITLKTAQGRRFIDSERGIRCYLSHRYGLPTAS